MTTLTGFAKLQGTVISKPVTVDFADRSCGGLSVVDASTGRALGVVLGTVEGFIAAPYANAFKMNVEDEVPRFLCAQLSERFITAEQAATALISRLLMLQAPALGFGAHLDVVSAEEIIAYAA